MTERAGTIQVTVVCPHREMRNVLWKIRHWQGTDPVGRQAVESVMPALTLDEALAAATHRPDRAIVVPIGFSAGEVRDRLRRYDLRHLEIVIRPPRGSTQPWFAVADDEPTASLLDTNKLIHAQDPLPAIRKALLRLRLKHQVAIRELASEQDLEAYFRLRYRVWREKGYLAPERETGTSDWEVHFSDRLARPLGAFTPSGELIGCARLVFPPGDEQTEVIAAISSALERRADPHLAECFRYPSGEVLPFDVLEALSGFGAYYRTLIRSRRSHAEVSRVIVHPGHRQHGLGEVLVDSLKTLARRRYGIHTLFLACHESMAEFYARSGFRILPGLGCERFCNVNASAIAMVCEPPGPAGRIH